MPVRPPGQDELAAIARGYAPQAPAAHAFEGLSGGFPAPPATA